MNERSKDKEQEQISLLEKCIGIAIQDGLYMLCILCIQNEILIYNNKVILKVSEKFMILTDVFTFRAFQIIQNK